jgi:oligogalacturonide transport system substrate-binding protein
MIAGGSMRYRYARTLFAVLVGLLGALPLAAEGKPDAGAAKTASEKIELRFGWWGDDSRHKAYIAAINRYMELHPNVKIIAEYGGWDGYKEKLYTQLAGGNAPHIFQNHYTWLDEQSQWKGKAVTKDCTRTRTPST